MNITKIRFDGEKNHEDIDEVLKSISIKSKVHVIIGYSFSDFNRDVV